MSQNEPKQIDEMIQVLDLPAIFAAWWLRLRISLVGLT